MVHAVNADEAAREAAFQLWLANRRRLDRKHQEAGLPAPPLPPEDESRVTWMRRYQRSCAVHGSDPRTDQINEWK